MTGCNWPSTGKIEDTLHVPVSQTQFTSLFAQQWFPWPLPLSSVNTGLPSPSLPSSSGNPVHAGELKLTLCMFCASKSSDKTRCELSLEIESLIPLLDL